MRKNPFTTTFRGRFISFGAGVIITLLLSALVSGLLGKEQHIADADDISEMTVQFQEEKNAVIGKLLPEGNYRCCLTDPCIYCIIKTPGHGEGATCDCLNDLVNGRHPCGECMGEILEGHGNPLLAEYFATAIAEEMGEQHLETFKVIIEEKYDFPAAQQL